MEINQRVATWEIIVQEYNEYLVPKAVYKVQYKGREVGINPGLLEEVRKEVSKVRGKEKSGVSREIISIRLLETHLEVARKINDKKEEKKSV